MTFVSISYAIGKIDDLKEVMDLMIDKNNRLFNALASPIVASLRIQTNDGIIIGVPSRKGMTPQEIL